MIWKHVWEWLRYAKRSVSQFMLWFDFGETLFLFTNYYLLYVLVTVLKLKTMYLHTQFYFRHLRLHVNIMIVPEEEHYFANERQWNNLYGCLLYIRTQLWRDRVLQYNINLSPRHVTIFLGPTPFTACCVVHRDMKQGNRETWVGFNCAGLRLPCACGLACCLTPWLIIFEDSKMLEYLKKYTQFEAINFIVTNLLSSNYKDFLNT